MTGAARCPQCGEELLAYAGEAGLYRGCPECLWADLAHVPVATAEQPHSLLDELPFEDMPGWMIEDIDSPPT